MMKARMSNPASVIPGAWDAVSALAHVSDGFGISETTRAVVHLRVSQINGCSSCVDASAKTGKTNGLTDEQAATVAAWRDAPYFTDTDRAALALAECVTRLADRSDPVPDLVWDEAARHYDEQALAALLLWIAAVNTFNRLNVPTRQVAGAWG